jgi:hypothetical protein
MIIEDKVATWLWYREYGLSESMIPVTVSAFARLVRIMSEYDLVEGELQARASVDLLGTHRPTVLGESVRIRSDMSPDDICALADGIVSEFPGHTVDGLTLGGKCCVPSAGGGSEPDEILSFSLYGRILDFGVLNAEMTTHADIWLPFDLHGRPQPEMYARYGPRLSGIVRGISEIVGEEAESDDPTRYAVATATGLENYYEDDGSAVTIINPGPDRY